MPEPIVEQRRALLEASNKELLEWLCARGEPALRARQVRRWLLAGRAETFAAMTDLPQGLRSALEADFVPLGTHIAHHSAADDDTHKLVLRLRDGQSIECVLIQEQGGRRAPEGTRRTACLSTQVGCGMGCVFCASGLEGVARNLTAGEIVEQLVRLRNLTPSEARLTNIVVMGMGEPLANFEALVTALEIAGDRHGLGIGARHVTISTVGLPVKIRKLADLGKPYHLAVSLHAPNDAIRGRIVPTNSQTGLSAILSAADYFFDKTGRRVTYEYVLLQGLNDGVEHARELAELLRGRCAHVNLIPFNDVAGLPYRRPSTETLTAFVNELRRSGTNVKVRKRKGSAIDAACGQLRRQVERQAHREMGDLAAGHARRARSPAQ